MKEIKLTQGKVALVDDEDYVFLNQFKWHAQKDLNTFYAIRTDRTTGRQLKISMHRIIMETTINSFVDHIDHNGLNNQRSNLRNCSHAQNHANRNANKTSKYKGISIRKNGQVIAEIRLGKNRIYLGCFKDARKAAMAYDKKALELNGEFANLNFK
jgi:hypothetical protein